jgi:hypothetical protein
MSFANSSVYDYIFVWSSECICFCISVKYVRTIIWYRYVLEKERQGG